jgi:hypothetical protein
VLCALDDGRTAAVPDTIWDAMHRVVLGEPFVAIGFPVTRTGEDFVLVNPGATVVEIPTVQLRLTAEQNPLSDLVGFSPFGHPSTNDRRMMAVTIPVAPYLPDGVRRALATQALVYLGRNHGYLDADINRL